jgi:hypothetical protein
MVKVWAIIGAKTLNGFLVRVFPELFATVIVYMFKPSQYLLQSNGFHHKAHANTFMSAILPSRGIPTMATSLTS